MKKFLLFSVLILTGCSGHKMISDIQQLNPENCPKNGACTIEIMHGKALDVKTDGTGKLYYALQDAKEKSVIKYTYSKHSNPEYQDDFYDEEVVFEVDKTTSKLNLTGKDIQKTKMLFGVKCFCKGKAGYYKVNSGSLHYRKKQFTISVPELVEGQLTKNIIMSLK
ncbi:hypothetical protein [Flavobacterium sp. MK4S-17]|uniref:hypothetical protein n=1 Tax=Flavobacterium sp. MK4S-17 TaxID=2543737 RepID=UPI001356DD4A|nr:hypothetical protein [Flavobacterium sp. MK4S-17]